eukprot:942291-Alexandrium_andersonii.AAC.1
MAPELRLPPAPRQRARAFIRALIRALIRAATTTTYRPWSQWGWGGWSSNWGWNWGSWRDSHGASGP